MADARRRRFDTVLVWKFNQFARSTTHLLSTLDEFRNLGIGFVSVHEAIDSTTPVMVFTVVAAIAELERTITIERVRAGLRRAKSQGKTLGRPRATIEQEKLLKLRAQGRSIREIAKALGWSRSLLARICKSVGPTIQ